MKGLLTILFTFATVLAFAQGPGDKAAIQKVVTTYTVQKIQQRSSSSIKKDADRIKYTVKVGKIKGNTATASISTASTLIYDNVVLEKQGGVWTVKSASLQSE